MINKATLQLLRKHYSENGGYHSVYLMRGNVRVFLVSTNCFETAKGVFKSAPDKSVGLILFSN